MRSALIISLLGLGAALALPAAADPEPHRHQHGQAAEAPHQHQHGAEAKEQAGSGMMEGGMMGGGMMHGRMKHCEHGGGDDLKERIRQLEKRLDLMQTTLELLAGRQSGGCPHHCERHGEQH